MVKHDVVERAVVVAEELDKIQRALQDADAERSLLAPDSLTQDLTAIVDGVGYDSGVSDAAAAIITAMEGGPMNIDEDNPLLPLGRALVLATQAEMGRTNDVGFHETVTHLLSTNGYESVSKKCGYEIFSKDDQVVALKEKGIDVHSARISDKFALDDFVDAFVDSRMSFEQYQETFPDEALDSLGYGNLTFYGTMATAFSTFGSIFYAASTLEEGAIMFASIPVGLVISAALAKLVNVTGRGIRNMVSGDEIEQRTQELYETQLAQTRKPELVQGQIYQGPAALVHAFPLEDNQVR